MPVLNGAKFLPEQLASLVSQTYGNWSLLIGDDGSQDDSKAILRAFVAAHPDKVQIFDGPGLGISANIMSLFERVNPTVAMVAYCDQDDVWDEGRLTRAVHVLQGFDEPALYCSRTRLVDVEGRFLRLSPARHRRPSFQNALVQNIASGNTMVMNRAAWMMLAARGRLARHVAYHDWWTYQLVSGANGTVIHDNSATLQYRQHDNNVLGAATGVRGAIKRLRRAANKNLSRDITSQLIALKASQDILTQDSADCLLHLCKSRSKGPLGRFTGAVRAGVYRQSRWGTLGLWVSALMGRI